MQGHDERLEGLLALGPRLSDNRMGERIASSSPRSSARLASRSRACGSPASSPSGWKPSAAPTMSSKSPGKFRPNSCRNAPACTSRWTMRVSAIQAREVGGDYYDFLDLGPRRLGLVLADVSGKGMSAALLMASLQASLRSHYAWTPDDLPRILSAVNRAFFESTESSRYATLFFGIYDEDTARFRYANCGHLPAVLMGADGSVRRLSATAPVIGLFDEWRCEVGETDLAQGDTLLVFSDGVVEAFDADDNEFGDNRLIELLRQNASLSADDLIRTVVDAVQRHSGSMPSDDFTLVVGRGRQHPEPSDSDRARAGQARSWAAVETRRPHGDGAGTRAA